MRTLEGSCYVQIYSQSGIELYTKFTTNVHDDFGEAQPITNAGDL